MKGLNLSGKLQATSQGASSLFNKVGVGMRSAGESLATNVPSPFAKEEPPNPEVAEIHQVRT